MWNMEEVGWSGLYEMTFMAGKLNIIRQLLNLFEDRRCVCCGSALRVGRYGVCEECENGGVFDTPMFKYRGNVLEQRLWGVTACEAASALMLFSDDSGARRLIHALKYGNDRGVGRLLGEAIGSRVLADERYDKIDVVIPVPLHPDKERLRGYNQSELMARAAAEVLGAGISVNNLYRLRNNVSQTHRHRLERMTNVKGVFAVREPAALLGKNILLVDDVFTSGATVIECCKALGKVEGIRVFVYTAAGVAR